MLKNKKIMAVLMAILAVCIACVFCFAACDAVVTNECNCDCGCENCTCNHDGETEIPREIQTYRFEAEEAELYADEAEMVYWLNNVVYQGEYIAGMGFIFDVQEDETASGEMSVGYLAHNNPTVTFVITSDIATTATLTLRAASCDVNSDGIPSVFGLMGAGINSYSGADHDILKVNGGSVALSGTLEGSDSVFSLDEGLALNNWGELTAEIELVEGANVIVLTHDGAGVNFDYIELETTGILSFNATDNDDFTYLPNGEYVPDDDEGDDEGIGGETGGETGGDDEGTGGETGGDTGDDEYENSMILEAEEGMLLNPVGTSGSTNLLGTEANSDGTSDQVKNFNLAGDMIAFQVLASAAVAVELTVTLNVTSMANIDSFIGSEHPTFLQVNGDAVEMNGEVEKNTYGELTASISLVAGINYIVLELDVSGRGGTLNFGLMNVDRIDLGWDGETTIEDYTTASSVFDIDTSETMVIEAEDAMLLNSVGITDNILHSNLIGTEVTTRDDGETITNVKNFNTVGDKIVFEVLAGSDIDNIAITIMACNAAMMGGTFEDNDKILTVNGSDPISLEGTLTNKAFNWTAYGELTGTISLVKGINYIVISVADMSLNVDYISLAW